jgi:hypothetical protein
LPEDAASGTRESFAATSLVAEVLDAGSLEWGKSLDHLVEFFPAHPGQSGVRDGLADPGPWGGDVVVVEEGAQLRGSGEPHGRGGDCDLAFGEQLARFGDPIADGEIADLEHVRKDLLGADLAEVDHCDQHPVRIGEQGLGTGALGAPAFATALVEGALLGLSGLGRGELARQVIQLGWGHAGQTRVGQDAQRCGADLRAVGADEEWPVGCGGSAGEDRVVPGATGGVGLDRQRALPTMTPSG